MKKVIRLPDSWEDVTIKQFQELSMCDNPVDKICVLSGEEHDVINYVDTESANRIWDTISWIVKMPTESNHKEMISFKGNDYRFRKLSTLSYGEWIDMHEYLKDDIQNLHKIMALLYYSVEHSRKELEGLFLGLDLQSAYGTLLFFSHIESKSLVSIRAYFQKEILLMEMKQQLNAKLEKQKNESKTDGLGTSSPTTWLKGILQSSKKYLA